MKLQTEDIAELQPIIEVVVDRVLAARAADEARLDSKRLSYTEKQAAEALGIPGHVLGDARRRGLIHGRRLGKQFLYSRQSLLDFLRGDE